MFVMHIALQGCLQAGGVVYGLTPDTGGHIRYLLELCRAVEAAGGHRQVIVTRRCEDPSLGPDYARRKERLSPRTTIERIDGASPDYVPKEGLWRERGVLCRNFVALLEGMEQKPDLIHAHYADAAPLAMAARDAFGIPFAFTAHSLGLVKRRVMGCEADTEDLRQRIATEAEAVGRADLVVASSRDEAEHQLALYPSHRPERTVLNPPGCDLSAFAENAAMTAGMTRVEKQVARHLHDTDKAPVFALARPVRKKNLTGLIEAFGRNEALRERANLVIYAGVREDLRDLDGEGQAVFAEMQALIDRYDLYGQIALPKNHKAEEVPAIYRWAARRGGVFCNPAKAEPFGLTLLEAAAAGLPVVSTRHGGPVDIVGRLANGALVDPDDPQAIGAAALGLISDRETWTSASRSGLERVAYYGWERHAADYLKDARQVTKPRPTALALAVPRSRMIVTDIDDTLVGEAESLAAFSRWHAANRGFHFAIATGRSLQDAIRILRQWDAPPPEVLITSVGSEIYLAHDLELRSLTADRDWAARIGEGWDAGAVRAAAEAVPGVSPQAPCEQRRFKCSYFTEEPGCAEEVQARLTEAGIEATVVHSHERYLDILPKRASKGQALLYLAGKLGLKRSATIAAGDSGNDVDLLQAAGRGVVVGNHRPELATLRGHKTAYFAKEAYAGGILEGLKVFDA